MTSSCNTGRHFRYLFCRSHSAPSLRSELEESVQLSHLQKVVYLLPPIRAGFKKIEEEITLSPDRRPVAGRARKWQPLQSFKNSQNFMYMESSWH